MAGKIGRAFERDIRAVHLFESNGRFRAFLSVVCLLCKVLRELGTLPYLWEKARRYLTVGFVFGCWCVHV